jgi:hypothetical protein
VVVGLTEELDYDNFKSEVAGLQGREEAAYEDSLHKVWSVMYRLLANVYNSIRPSIRKPIKPRTT